MIHPQVITIILKQVKPIATEHLHQHLDTRYHYHSINLTVALWPRPNRNPMTLACGYCYAYKYGL